MTMQLEFNKHLFLSPTQCQLAETWVTCGTVTMRYVHP